MGYRVSCLDLRELDNSTNWNPFLLPFDCYKHNEQRKAMELLGEMVSLIVNDDSVDEQFWNNTAKDVIVGFILLMFENASREECHIKSLLSLWQSYLDDKEKILDMIKKYEDHFIMQSKLSCLYSSSDKTVGSIETMVTMGLNRFAINKDLVELLSHEELDLEKIVEGKNGVYLIIPDENKYYHFIVSLFLEQLYEILIKEAQTNKKNQLTNRMNFVIDEFANLPKIENMDSMITAARSRNIRFFLVVQSMQQLNDKYEDMADVICSNCNNWIYLYSKEYDLLREISQLCGEVIYDNNIRMPLISEFDLQHLKKEEGEALVLCDRQFPCIVNLKDIDDYPFSFDTTKQVIEKREEKLPAVVVTLQRKPKIVLPPQKNENKPCEAGLSKQEIFRRLYMREECTKERVWVTASYKGMILINGACTKEEYESGTIKTKLCVEYLQNIREIKYLTWRCWDSKYEESYKKFLNQHFEYAFMMEKELEGDTGKTNFVETQGQEFYKLTLKLSFNGIKKEQLLCAIPYLKGEVGMHYAYHVLLRLANEKLANYNFHHRAWELVPFHGDAPATDISLQKTINQDNYAIAKMEYIKVKKF